MREGSGTGDNALPPVGVGWLAGWLGGEPTGQETRNLYLIAVHRWRWVMLLSVLRRRTPSHLLPRRFMFVAEKFFSFLSLPHQPLHVLIPPVFCHSIMELMKRKLYRTEVDWICLLASQTDRRQLERAADLHSLMDLCKDFLPRKQGPLRRPERAKVCRLIVATRTDYSALDQQEIKRKHLPVEGRDSAELEAELEQQHKIPLLHRVVTGLKITDRFANH